MQLIPVKEIDFNKKYVFYDIIEDMNFVPLETTEESTLGKVSKIQFFKGYMIILDNESRSILIFDNNGRYVNKISRVGVGPYEYQDINDFCVHPQTGEISIATNMRKILNFSFDLKKCTLFDKTPYVVGIERFGNGYYALATTDKNANVLIADTNMNIVYKGKPNPFEFTALLSKTFSKYKDTVLCRLPTCYNDTIYRISNGSIKPWSAPDYEFHADNSNPSKYFTETAGYGRSYSNPEMHGTEFYSESDKFISFSMTYPKMFRDSRLTSVLYSKKNKNVKLIRLSDVKEVPFSGLFFRFGGEVDISGRFAQKISSLQILKCKIIKEDTISLRLMKLKSQLNEESNPVIMFIKFKE